LRSDGEKIVFQGEADQLPDQEPGDIVFLLQQKHHDVFERRRSDLIAHIKITLAEALCGISRVVIKTLDGRGLSINHQKPTGGVLKPGQTIKIMGEGMPIKRSSSKGDLYLIVEVEFPGDDWLEDETLISTLKKALPKHSPSITADVVDEVEHEAKDVTVPLQDDSQDSEWEDQDGYSQARAQCPQQ
jgi:DnaJ family protein A protein 2